MDEEARQARLIFSEIGDESYPLNQLFNELHLTATVWNYSDLPVFNLVVTMDEIGSGRDGFRILTPHHSVDVELVLRLHDTGKPNDISRPRKEGVTLHFLDGGGRHWRRKGSNQPERVLGEALSARVPLERFDPEKLRHH